MTSKNVNILIADAQLLTREGLKTLLSQYKHLKVIGESTHFDELLADLDHHDPDLVIMDYSQEPHFSMEDLSRIQNTHPNTHILVITSDLKRDKVLNALGYGVKGFLTKACDADEVLGAIRSVAKGEKFFCSKVLDIILEREIPRVKVGDPTTADDKCDPIQLTQRELEIVKLMVEGLSAQQIADKLFLSVHTIYTHRKNIMRKLEVTSAAEVILYAIKTRLVPSASN